MTRFGGESSVEVAAPAAACFELVCDTPRTPEWQRAIRAVEVLELDSAGRTSLVRARIDPLVAQIELDLRLSYEEPRRLHMWRERGDLKDLTAAWTFEELSDDRTRVAFETEFDPGRVMSALARGPLIAKLEKLLAVQPTRGLREALESPR